MLNKLITISLVMIFFASCTHSVHLVHVGDFRPYQKITAGKTIEASAEQWLFLGFTQETDYVEIAHENFLKQCPNGIIQGPVTRLSTSHGFLSWTNKIHMQGLCVQLKNN